MPAFSIVIPVFNQWQLSRNCLLSLKATLPDSNTELILVDNASTDVTPRAAPFLGKELFGENFTFIRNERNRNFAGASNQGARAARGNFLIFLNNDTVALSGWLRPLIDDFKNYPNLAGTAPLLLYPEKPLLGHTVQHLGVSVSSFKKVAHLYEGIPASSPLAKKRRFFQIITAACLMIPRELFLNAGAFDEEYKNGFEDVDLCGRLSRAGFRFTVNPESRIIHYQGQSSGRRDGEEANRLRLRQKALPLLLPDKRNLLLADNLTIELNEWQIEAISMGNKEESLLGPELDIMDRDELLAILVQHPYWRKGWKKLYWDLDDAHKLDIADSIFRFVPEPSIAMQASRASLSLGNLAKARYWFNTASVFCQPESAYLDACQTQAALAAHIGDTELKGQYESCAAGSKLFFKNTLRPFIADFASLARQLGIKDGGLAPWAFALDFDLKRENPYGGLARDFNALEYRKAHAADPEPVKDCWLHYLTSLKRKK